MNLILKLSVVTIFFLQPVAGWAGTQEETKVVEQPSVQTTEPWKITIGVPGWLPAATGHIGLHGVNPYVSVPFGQILKHINYLGSFSGEVQRGRFGALGDFILFAGQAGTPERPAIHRRILWFLPTHRGTPRLVRSAGWV